MEVMAPWIYAVLEGVKHADEHHAANGDFDRHIAFIGYDNSIEISINTYLQLHPIQRGGAEYEQKQVNHWLTNYHTLLDFFFDVFLKTSGQTPRIAKSTIIHYHTLRNKLYHEGKNFVPAERDLQEARGATLYIFSTLFNIDGEELLKSLPPLHTWMTKKFDTMPIFVYR